jgi:hypothetical protein
MPDAWPFIAATVQCSKHSRYHSIYILRAVRGCVRHHAAGRYAHMPSDLIDGRDGRI